MVSLHVPCELCLCLGEPSKNIFSLIHWSIAIPCPETRSGSGKAHLLPSSPQFLSKRQEDQVQGWQELHPVRSRLISIPQEVLLVERENDLSTYNWNSFGLRYGKRQAMKTKMKL